MKISNNTSRGGTNFVVLNGTIPRNLLIEGNDVQISGDFLQINKTTRIPDDVFKEFIEELKKTTSTDKTDAVIKAAEKSSLGPWLGLHTIEIAAFALDFLDKAKHWPFLQNLFS